MCPPACAGIEGWGINNPDPRFFRTVPISPPVAGPPGLAIPPAPPERVYRLVPHRGSVVILIERDGDESYYVLVGKGPARYYRRSAPTGEWARCREVATIPGTGLDSPQRDIII